MKKVLCVCMGNTCRSPVLEAMLRAEAVKHGIKDLVFESAGTKEACRGQNANEHSVDCMRDQGLDITAHRARFVGDLNLKEFSLIVAVEPEMRDLLLTMGASESQVIVANPSEGGIENPFQKGRPAYDQMVRSVERAIPAILAVA